MSTPTTARQAGTKATDVRPRSARHAGYRRAAALTAAALTTMAATVVLAPVTHAVIDRPPVENVSAGAAVSILTAGGSDTTPDIPDDFAARFGYRPSLVDGLLADPGGDCSSPVTLPDEFETACKAHDLGYDLLRYADSHGEPLGPWARQALDNTLGQHMHEACDVRTDSFSRARCKAMATIAYTFVDINSRRQGFSAPVAESLWSSADSQSPRTFSGWLAVLIGGGVLGLAAAGAALVGVTPNFRRPSRTIRGARGPVTPVLGGSMNQVEA
ncbi:hypothetical protein ACLMAJ_16225 [Nocardia sp. KC 131]|uniref:hypothetical protein n=1 Tax=Nocardia arseniciresistens TaxID=3392119 RepID=UPI00398F8D1B